MFQDEAGFGRINKPKYCWCQKGIRPSVPCHHIREYRYAYGAVEPKTGDSFFLIMPYCNTDCMNLFLQELSKTFADDVIVLACDGARWHKSKTMQIPDNIIGNTAYIPLFKTGYRKTRGKNAESIDLCSIIAQRRSESDRQGFPVSQIQIRQCEHDEVFGCLFSQTSVSCLSIAEKLFNDSKDVLYFTTDR